MMPKSKPKQKKLTREEWQRFIKEVRHQLIAEIREKIEKIPHYMEYGDTMFTKKDILTLLDNQIEG